MAKLDRNAATASYIIQYYNQDDSERLRGICEALDAKDNEVEALVKKRTQELESLRATLQAQEARADKAEGEVERLERLKNIYENIAVSNKQNLQVEQAENESLKSQVAGLQEDASNYGEMCPIMDALKAENIALKEQVSGLVDRIKVFEKYASHRVEAAKIPFFRYLASEERSGKLRCADDLVWGDVADVLEAIYNLQTLAQSWRDEVRRQGAEAERARIVSWLDRRRHTGITTMGVIQELLDYRPDSCLKPQGGE